MALRARLDRSESPENLRRRLIEEAEDYRRRHPVPSQKKVLEEILYIRESMPVVPTDPDTPNSTALLRESRGSLHDPWGWEDEQIDPAELKERLIEEAEAYRSRYPVPPLAEVVDEIIQNGTYRSADLGAPDCVELIREDRDR